jgi:hypothetical protein
MKPQKIKKRPFYMKAFLFFTAFFMLQSQQLTSSELDQERPERRPFSAFEDS